MSALSLDRAKRHLNITTTTSDVELQDTINAAEALLGRWVGPLTTQAPATVRLVGGVDTLVLPVAPIQSVSAVVGVDSAVVNVADLALDQSAGMLRYADMVTRFGAIAYDVTYVAGWATVPEDLLYAIQEEVRHLWATQRGGGVRPGAPVDQQTPGYLLPYRVQELIEPYRLIAVGAA